MKDFEDAVVAFLAQNSGCAYVITGNSKDFEKSPVRPLTPEEFIRKHVTVREP